MHLDEHLAVHGELPQERRRRRRGESALIELVELAGLRGCGGGGFPTATKLRDVARRRRRSIVAINAAEGEPASLKDRTLSQRLPHLMLDGGQLAARAVGAAEVVVCVCETASASVHSIAGAIEERRWLPGVDVPMRVGALPDGYLAGQESALVRCLNGGPALPTFTPPRPSEQGVGRHPTLVSNAETLAQLALIARHGAEWFRELGTSERPGSALVTLCGAVAHPGVFEIEHGCSLSSLVDAAGGTTEPVRAALVGGYAGTWIDGSLLDGLALADVDLAPHGATLGAGVVLLLPERACPVAETSRITSWLADQSARQCGPCLNGLYAIAELIQGLAQGVSLDTQRRGEQLASLVRGRGACAHPDGTVQFALSALKTFAPEFADHARHGPCDACMHSPELPLSRKSRRREPAATP
ncbi:MAG TPA: NADH-ubiquinone oxidoreductase-F iron-sulfur binding region domain-containing protein [Solirubrobacteraceae bacterium]|jgi:NADH:ubiquinone oxidoreductase subunit F (NADH-binding)|nr:NADH-ubiquinone oxidoreductase-F iron-sulfur binding region domain-containing protein [Solirubrobacteraceae bacterium]